MDVLFVYLLKGSLAQLTLFGLYWLFLRKETFHQANRFFLLGILAISLVLPLLPFPDFAPTKTVHFGTSVTSSVQAAYYTLLSQPVPTIASTPAETAESMNVSTLIYWIMVSLGSIYFFVQVLALYRIIRRSVIQTRQDYILASSEAVGNPFSFFRYIIVPIKSIHDPSFEQVLRHEQVHVQQWHTLDILLTEIYAVFFWFNPFAWWHKKMIRLNLEYLADKGVLAAGIHSQQYQLNLLKITLAQPNLSLANNFNRSFVRKRILMMNSPYSSRTARLKYLLCIPLLCGLCMLFNLTKATEVESNLRTFSSNLSSVVQKSTWNATKQGNTRIINGIVKDADTDRPIHRAHIKIKGQSTDVSTDALGRFSIDVNQEDKVLVVETFPYQGIEMVLTPLNEMTILLRLSDRAKYEGNRYGPNGIFVGGSSVFRSSFNEIITLYKPVAIMASPAPLPDSILYIIDGKKVDKTAIQALNPEEIEKVMIYKRYEAEQRFGKGAGPGVVDVYTKK
jgi:beta-lactamase regulating signal transducer with metallopeptidase domain